MVCSRNYDYCLTKLVRYRMYICTKRFVYFLDKNTFMNGDTETVVWSTVEFYDFLAVIL